MQLPLKELYFSVYWILGTKTKQEKTFFIQIIEKEKKMLKLKSELLGNKDIDFYITEIKLPSSIKQEFDCPF